jgi:hypothetical protein
VRVEHSGKMFLALLVILPVFFAIGFKIHERIKRTRRRRN